MTRNTDRSNKEAALVRWRECYEDLWKLKIAFDEEHNMRRITERGVGSPRKGAPGGAVVAVR